MILINGQWEDVQSISDISNIIRTHFSESLADELDNLTAAILDRDKEELLDLQSELTDLYDENYEMTKENNDLKRRINELEEEIQNLQNQINALQEENDNNI